MPLVFMSYSWDSESHKSWTRELAKRLRSDGIDVKLDQWELAPGDQLPKFMESAVRESEFILIVCTQKYKDKSDNRVGGVGYEGDIMTAEVLSTRNERKFIPILRELPPELVVPTWLSGKLFVDLSGSKYSESQYYSLITSLLGTREKPPPVRSTVSYPPTTLKSSSNQPSKSEDIEFIPLRIIDIIIDQIGSPLGDGTRGSALYKVPIRLSQTPPDQWSKLFIQAWDHPSHSSSMHRPGIASIVGDSIILNGTDVDEIETYHKRTLTLAVTEANKKYIQILENAKRDEEQKANRLLEHRIKVEEKAKQIKFDDG